MAGLVHCPTKHKYTCCYIASVEHTVAYGCIERLAFSVVGWYAMYIPETSYRSVALAQWQVWAGLANISNVAAKVATSVLCRLVGEHSKVRGCTSAVVCIVWTYSPLY